MSKGRPKNLPQNPDEVITGIKSSHISALEYYISAQRLVVTFNDNAQWAYSPVTPDVFASLKNAQSKGQFFHQYIRNNDSITPTRI